MMHFLRTWMLAVSIAIGALAYCLFIWFPALSPYEAATLNLIKFIQPWFIFAMLFITFCKVDPRKLHLRRWHKMHLLLQGGSFTLLALTILIPTRMIGEQAVNAYRPIIESAMLCLVCPTATAAAVVTGKLGGDMEGLTTYTILINLLVAALIPAVVPLLSPHATLGFWSSFVLILGKVLPLLICPFLLALVVRSCSPRLLHVITHIKDIAFYLWAVSLALAIMVSVKSLWETTAATWVLGGIAIVSLLSCILQFWFGRRIGHRHEAPISAGQALGQKNTVFLIWCGYTFFAPVTSIAGGFYSIWHNLWNSYQIAKHNSSQ